MVVLSSESSALISSSSSSSAVLHCSSGGNMDGGLADPTSRCCRSSSYSRFACETAPGAAYPHSSRCPRTSDSRSSPAAGDVDA